MVIDWDLYRYISILVGGLKHDFIFPDIGNFIIPIDFHIFFRGVQTTNQKFGGFFHIVPLSFRLIRASHHSVGQKKDQETL